MNNHSATDDSLTVRASVTFTHPHSPDAAKIQVINVLELPSNLIIQVYCGSSLSSTRGAEGEDHMALLASSQRALDGGVNHHWKKRKELGLQYPSN
jgi:hypothetical protein